MERPMTPEPAAVQAARKIVEKTLDLWPRLLEKRCDEGEWVKLRDLFTEAMATYAAAQRDDSAEWKDLIAHYEAERTDAQIARSERDRLRAALVAISNVPCGDKSCNAALLAEAALSGSA
jgi:hypothetical protein